MRDQLFHMQPGGGATLQSQLRQKLVSAILDGHVPPGSPLPSCRKLAKTLGVARNTVVLAYQDLVDEGFLVPRERSGYYVNEDVLVGRVAEAAAAPPAKAGSPQWASRLKLVPSTQRQVVKPRDWQNFQYPFIYGQFDPALFPLTEWRECTRQALGVQAVREWAIDSYTVDDALLVEQIRTRILPRRGILAAPEEILVTVGAQHALYLLACLLVTRRTRVGVENPGYSDARNIFALKTSRLTALDVDDDGIVVDGRMDGCDYVYTTPSHQYPTIVTLSLERRRALLEKAADANLVLIEDDYESEINHVGDPVPALKSMDDNDRVVFVSSLSKTLAPGLRVGYMVGPADVIREARSLRRLMLRHPPTNNQRTVALFVARGHYDSLMRRLSHTLKDRWEAMARGLDRHLPECAPRPVTGGTSFWIEGPPSLDTYELERRAAEQGILIEPGGVNFMSATPPRNYFRLGFSSIAVDRIEPGLRLLGELVRRSS